MRTNVREAVAVVISLGRHFVAHAANGSGGDSDEAFHGVVGVVCGVFPRDRFIAHGVMRLSSVPHLGHSEGSISDPIKHHAARANKVAVLIDA